MDETTGKNKFGSSGEAMVVLFFLFSLAIFLLYKFGHNTTSVHNLNENTNSNTGVGNIENLSNKEIFAKLKSEGNSEIYSKYLEKIESLKNGTVNVDNSTQDLTGDIGEEYKKELENKVILPEQIISIKGKIVENSFNDRAKYLNDFEILLSEFKGKNGFSENRIFLAQINGPTPALPIRGGGNATLLELSDYDRGTILRISIEYDIWADKILNLNTPKIYIRKSIEAAKSAKNVSYILRKIVEEKDQAVYPLWIAKYIETIFDILANRYAK